MEVADVLDMPKPEKPLLVVLYTLIFLKNIIFLGNLSCLSRKSERESLA